MNIEYEETRTVVHVNSVAELFDFYMKPQNFFGNRYAGIFQDSQHIPQDRIGKFFSDPDYFDPWGQFVFRGQSDTEWRLETSIFRQAVKYGNTPPIAGLQKQERTSLREFKRQYKRLENKPIDNDAYHEWFAVMQHHGAPTRLLDFTYSFYVALYFASNNVSFSDGRNKVSFSVYAVNYPFVEYMRNTFLTDELKEMAKGPDGDSQMKTSKIQMLTITALDKEGVLLVTPFHLNTRLVRQRGTFLMPTKLACPFEENLKTILVGEHQEPLNTKVIKMNITLTFQDVHYLYRQLNYMNVSAQTLFEDNLDTLGEVVRMKMFTAKYTDMLADNTQGVIRGE